MARKVGHIVRRGALTWLVREYNGVGGSEDGSTMAEPVGTTSPRVDGGESGATIEPNSTRGKFSGRVRVMMEQSVVLSPRPS